ncbi:MAG: MarR family winged helix-turn-helix transcriptional regulator [Burkholderiaceae bacterium]
MTDARRAAAMSPADEGPPPDFANPKSIFDLVNYQLHLVEFFSGLNITRMCEGGFGVTRQEWRYIALLAGMIELTPSELAIRSGLDRSRTSKILMQLIEKGLVQRRAQAGDRRRAAVQLTVEGHALYRRIFPRVVELNHALLAALPQQDVEALERILSVLRRRAISLSQANLVEVVADRRHGGSRKRWAARPQP